MKNGEIMKGEILSMDKIFDNISCSNKWQVCIEFEEIPPFKLGDYKVTQ